MRNWKETSNNVNGTKILHSFVLETQTFLKTNLASKITWQLLDKSNWIPSDFRAAQGRGSCQDRPWPMPPFNTIGTWRLAADDWVLLFCYREPLNLPSDFEEGQ